MCGQVEIGMYYCYGYDPVNICISSTSFTTGLSIRRPSYNLWYILCDNEQKKKIWKELSSACTMQVCHYKKFDLIWKNILNQIMEVPYLPPYEHIPIFSRGGEEYRKAALEYENLSF